MEDADNNTPAHYPKATHWNTSRNPLLSFSCPTCRERIILKPTFRPDPGMPKIVAICDNCDIAFAPEYWAARKVEEMNGGS